MLMGSWSCRLVDNPDYREIIPAEGSNILLRVTSPEGEPIPLARVTVGDQVGYADGAGFVQFESLPVGVSPPASTPMASPRPRSS